MLVTGRLASNTSTAEWHMTQRVMPHDVGYNGNTPLFTVALMNTEEMAIMSAIIVYSII